MTSMAETGSSQLKMSCPIKMATTEAIIGCRNGYTVLGLLTEEGELVTVVGCIPLRATGYSRLLRTVASNNTNTSWSNGCQQNAD